MDFKRYLKESAIKIDREVDKILKNELQRAKQKDHNLVPLIRAFMSACKGGKRIRGVLTILGYELGKQSSVISYQLSDKKQKSLTADSEAILRVDSSIFKIAAALEICHSAILVHDDIMDKSPTRRLKPSLYKALGGKHYGTSQAINLGDWGFFLSFKIISESKFELIRKNDALVLFSQIMMDTGLGQMLDLQKVNPSLVMRLKTAYYTIVGPLQIGAILGGTSKQLVKALGEFGESLGIVYQIRDDVLDNEADSTIGTDNAEREAEKYKDQAMKVIPQLTKDTKMSKLLEQLAEYLIKRKK